MWIVPNIADACWPVDSSWVNTPLYYTLFSHLIIINVCNAYSMMTKFRYMFYPLYLTLKATYCSNYTLIHIANEMAFCHNLCNSSYWDSCITKQLGFKHSFCQNVVSTKYSFSWYLHKNITRLSVGLLRSVQLFPFHVTVYQLNYDKLLFHEWYLLPFGKIS